MQNIFHIQQSYSLKKKIKHKRWSQLLHYSAHILVFNNFTLRIHTHHKKGNTSDIKNYRPISLLPIMYKVFSNILLQRMIRTLDFHQPREQAGFRSGYSMIDHLQVVNQLQEKANEYNMPLCFAFVDYEKAFDSIEFEPLFEGF